MYDRSFSSPPSPYLIVSAAASRASMPISKVAPPSPVPPSPCGSPPASSIASERHFSRCFFGSLQPQNNPWAQYATVSHLSSIEGGPVPQVTARPIGPLTPLSGAPAPAQAVRHSAGVRVYHLRHKLSHSSAHLLIYSKRGSVSDWFFYYANEDFRFSQWYLLPYFCRVSCGFNVILWLCVMYF